ncbi:hypothetical protein [Desulfosudis oleivorans]|uniref:hypothetical protein n=1 Tax=Desulfosudis oleivorans TaxID=181663 RepID=UPI0012947EB1|nr:hypothetical protein [Desulfosudis oleivorans]
MAKSSFRLVLLLNQPCTGCKKQVKKKMVPALFHHPLLDKKDDMPYCQPDIQISTGPGGDHVDND